MAGIVGIAVIVGIAGFAVLGGGDTNGGDPESSAEAFIRLTAGRDVTSVGSLGDITDPESLRARIERLLDADDPTVAISDETAAAARDCWRRTDPGSRADLDLLVGRGTVGGDSVTFLAVTDRGRVIAFVLDEQCQVIAAQSI